MDLTPEPSFQIVNDGTATVDLSSLTIRYFFTKDGAPASDLGFSCDFAQVGCGQISSTFGSWTGTNADEYLELSFLAGSGNLAPGASSGLIEARFHAIDYAYTFTQTNDYSFDATKTSFTPWMNVTLYQDGMLVWGAEP